MNEKIRTDHRERAAYVYVRPSTLRQVPHRCEGQPCPYGLADQARHVGVAQGVVIDEARPDGALTAATAADVRPTRRVAGAP